MLVLSMLALGLASGVHCVAMCGGFATAFSARRVIRLREARPATGGSRLLAFNAGRIATYSVFGALAGGLGGFVGGAVGAQSALYLAANALLILIGLHLAGLAPWFSRVEKIGAPLWRWLAPLASQALARRSAFVAGLFWGALPCGLVYAALGVAAIGGSAPAGAAAMAAYGLGTLPWLAGAGFAAALVPPRLAGGAVLALGIYGLAHAEGIAGGLARVLYL